MFFIWDWGLATRFCIWLESLMYPTFEFWFWTCDCSYNGMLKTRHKTIQNTTSWINYEQLNKPIHFFGVGGNHMYFVVIIAKLQAYDRKRKEKENANLNVKNIEFKSTNLNWHPKHQKKKKEERHKVNTLNQTFYLLRYRWFPMPFFSTQVDFFLQIILLREPLLEECSRMIHIQIKVLFNCQISLKHEAS